MKIKREEKINEVILLKIILDKILSTKIMYKRNWRVQQIAQLIIKTLVN